MTLQPVHAKDPGRLASLRGHLAQFSRRCSDSTRGALSYRAWSGRRTSPYGRPCPSGYVQIPLHLHGDTHARTCWVQLHGMELHDGGVTLCRARQSKRAPAGMGWHSSSSFRSLWVPLGAVQGRQGGGLAAMQDGCMVGVCLPPRPDHTTQGWEEIAHSLGHATCSARHPGLTCLYIVQAPGLDLLMRTQPKEEAGLVLYCAIQLSALQPVL